MKLSIRESSIKEAREHKDPYVVSKAKDGKFWVGRKSDTVDIHSWGNYDTEEEAQARADKYNAKFYISEIDADEVADWFNSIDFTPVFEKCNRLVGKRLTYDVKLETNRAGQPEYFEIESRENLATMFPVLAAAWREFKVGTFNARITLEDNTGDIYLWGSMDYRYEHNEGGSNGAHLFYFNYKDGKFDFR